MNQRFRNNLTTLFICITILGFLSIEVVLNLTPPISRDALIHHLAVPKLWLRRGGLYEIPWADFSYFPMNIDLFYLACLYFKNDIAPKFIHLAFGLGTGGLVYVYLNRKFGRNWGLLGMLMFISTPIVVWLATSAYIDLGMTFFTTGSVLAFIRWRDSDFENFRWLLISSFSMGIALGCKYNALIAWFVLNLLVVQAYARQTNRQIGALKYGLIFSAVAAAAAFPWYLKNYAQTGNPFYPLFNSFFKSLHDKAGSDILFEQATRQAVRTNFFRMREIAYGETFWETLTIPLRMFFQGDDTGYRYFQGVLNPVLIVFAPFIMFDRKHMQDKALFVILAGFIIAVTYFTTLQQVRYITPALPFLSILAVMGIKNLADRSVSETPETVRKTRGGAKHAAAMILVVTVAGLLSLNGLYIVDRLKLIKPWPYVSGRETRESFLKRHLLHYDAVDYINSNLPDDAVIYQLFLGRRGYYLNRAYKNEPSFGMDTLTRMVEGSGEPDQFKQIVRSIGATHILMRTDLVINYLRDNFSQEEIQRFLTLVEKYWEPLHESNVHGVWAIGDFSADVR